MTVNIDPILIELGSHSSQFVWVDVYFWFLRLLSPRRYSNEEKRFWCFKAGRGKSLFLSDPRINPRSSFRICPIL